MHQPPALSPDRIEPFARLSSQTEGPRNDPGGLLGPLLPAVIDS